MERGVRYRERRSATEWSCRRGGVSGSERDDGPLERRAEFISTPLRSPHRSRYTPLTCSDAYILLLWGRNRFPLYSNFVCKIRPYLIILLCVTLKNEKQQIHKHKQATKQCVLSL